MEIGYQAMERQYSFLPLQLLWEDSYLPLIFNSHRKPLPYAIWQKCNIALHIAIRRAKQSVR